MQSSSMLPLPVSDLPHPAGACPAPPTPPQLPTLALGPGQTGRLVAALLPWLAQGRRCYCLDGGNTFDPYELSTEARAQGLDPAPLLERIFISRAYTCHQLLEAVATMLPPLAEHPTPPLVLILGLDRMFLTDELALEERRRVFERIVARAVRLVQRGLPLLATLAIADCGLRIADCEQGAFRNLLPSFKMLNDAAPHFGRWALEGNLHSALRTPHSALGGMTDGPHAADL